MKRRAFKLASIQPCGNFKVLKGMTQLCIRIGFPKPRHHGIPAHREPLSPESPGKLYITHIHGVQPRIAAMAGIGNPALRPRQRYQYNTGTIETSLLLIFIALYIQWYNRFQVQLLVRRFREPLVVLLLLPPVVLFCSGNAGFPCLHPLLL